MEWALPASVSPCLYRDFPDSPPALTARPTPFLAQGGEAIRSEAWIAVSTRFVSRRKSTESLEDEAFRFVANSSRDATIADMNNIISSQVPPKHLNRAGIEDCLRRILSNQQSIATTFWEAFQSLGYRLDKHDMDFEIIRDRLWRIEHPKAEKLLKEALGLEMSGSKEE